jgi:hypothetical protein
MDSNVLVGTGSGVFVAAKVEVGSKAAVEVADSEGEMAIGGVGVAQPMNSQYRLVPKTNLIHPCCDIHARIAGMEVLFKDEGPKSHKGFQWFSFVTLCLLCGDKNTPVNSGCTFDIGFIV